MVKQYSIAQARDEFAALVHELENVSRIELTRRGEPVAVLLSIKEYHRLSAHHRGFSDAYAEFRQRFKLSDLNITPGVFADVRDRAAGREIEL